MMLLNRCLLTALIVCTSMIASCAGTPQAWKVAPPRLILPETASRPCALHRLPERPTLGDLEAGYMVRGRQIADCDAARQIAVDTLFAERSAGDAALRASHTP